MDSKKPSPLLILANKFFDQKSLGCNVNYFKYERIIDQAFLP